MKKIFIGLCITLLFSACDEDAGWDCLKSYGDDTTEIRFTAAFSEVNIEDNLRITYHRDSAYRVEVRFGDHLIDKVETEVREGVLYLSNTARCNWVRDLSQKPEIAIYAPSLSGITNYGSGILACADTIRTGIFTYNQWDTNGIVNLLIDCNQANIFAHQGFVDLSVAGRCSEANLYSKSNGSFRAAGLQSETVFIRQETFQDMLCFASVAIYGEIFRAGNIRFGGDPATVEVARMGIGAAIPL